MTSLPLSDDDASPFARQRLPHHTDFKYKKFSEATSGESNRKDNPRFNVALFGIGRAGLIHLVNATSNLRLRLMYIVELDSSKAKRIQNEYHLESTVILTPAEEDVIFKDPKIHGVIVATSTFSHEAIVTKALRAGKAVFCEKPISQDEEETRRCYGVAQKMKKPLFCAFNRRFDPSFVEVYRQVSSGHVGKVHLIKTVARDSPLPPIDYLKISGGIFHDCGVHDIDLICWMLGEYPSEVFAVASCFIPEIKELGDYDTVAMTLKFESGAIGMVDLSRNAVYGYDQRLEVFGPKGMVAASNEKPMQVTYSSLSGQSLPPIYHSFPSRYHEGYVQELHHFCDLMEGKTTAMTSPENTLKVTKIANAMEESVKTGRLVKVRY